MTEEGGRRLRAAVMAASAGSGVAAAVVSGLANEYADYFTTPEEYDAQHYEGAATIYGRTSSLALQQTDVELARDVVGAKPAPAPYAYDPRHGVLADAAAFPPGAASATVAAQPAPTAHRLGHPVFSWRGGERGYDRPLDHAFVLVQRRVRGHWTGADSDLGLHILWSVDDNGLYSAEWEVPLSAPRGTYRFVVHGNRYRLESTPFRVAPSDALTAQRVDASPGHVAVALGYPAPVVHEDVGTPPPDATADLTTRPKTASAGTVTFLVNDRPVTVTVRRGGRFEVPAGPGDEVKVRAGAARDRYGNVNGNDLTLDG
jgi:neutral ceramidase